MIRLCVILSFLCVKFSLTSAADATHGHAKHAPNRCPLKPPSAIRTAPLIIAHRGASFHLPEHTLAAYRLALELGTDYIEPDLVGTKDGRLVVVHSFNLNITTNVAEVFPDRSSTLENGDTGYFSYNFDLDEIKQLKVKQRMPDARSTTYDGMFDVPSFQDALQLLHEWNHDTLPLLTRDPKLERAGVYAELKDPELYQQMTNLSMVDVFLHELELASKHMPYLQNDTVCNSLKYDEYVVPPLVVQSFDGSALQQVHTDWPYNTTLPLVLLTRPADCFKEDFWFHTGESREYLMGIGVDKSCLLGDKVREFMNRAEEYDLAVHAWVERRELSEVGNGFDNLQQELKHLFCDVGVDGVFAENVADAVLVAQVGCDKNTTEQAEPQPPTEAPPASTTATNGTQNANSSSNTNPSSLCYASDDELELYIGVAAGVLGILIGSVVTLCISNSRCCRKRRQRRHQLVVPQHDDGELI